MLLLLEYNSFQKIRDNIYYRYLIIYTLILYDYIKAGCIFCIGFNNL